MSTAFGVKFNPIFFLEKQVKFEEKIFKLENERLKVGYRLIFFLMGHLRVYIQVIYE